ncbi:MAG: hypothetical protein HPY51_18245 [Candidatus Omnitrophica bacterium]|nr:hypothetical protein [Candidatus Omnitrophota bacterium]
MNRQHQIQPVRYPDLSCVIIDSLSVKTASGGDSHVFEGVGKDYKFQAVYQCWRTSM